MSDEIVARVKQFARRTLDLHLPVLLGLMAEKGTAPKEQSARAAGLVEVLRTAKVEPSLTHGGRPRAVALQGREQAPQLVVNAQMVARVDDDALASALAEPVARLLDISVVSVGLVLGLGDVAKVRGLAGRLRSQAQVDVISVMAVGPLVRWRLDRFEHRLFAVVEGLGGWAEPPAPPSPEHFIAELAETAQSWPEWRQVHKTPYLSAWADGVSRELGGSDWADHGPRLVEMVWESVVISPASALRQAAQKLRASEAGGAHQHLLEALADAMEVGGELGDRSIDSWPGFQSLAQAWRGLVAREDEVLGAHRQQVRIPKISVFERPGPALGVYQPESLPWEMPLLCWTVREHEALRDLLEGMNKSLAAQGAQFRRGRLGPEAMVHRPPPQVTREEKMPWVVTAPTRWTPLEEGFEKAIDRAFASVRRAYLDAFEGLEAADRRQVMSFVSGTYVGYLRSARPVWDRRLRAADGQPPAVRFDIFITALAQSLGWPIFIDPFEEGVASPLPAQMPRFTVLALWYDDAETAPLWIPVEAIGEALGQAPIRIRHVAVDRDCSTVGWLGDQEFGLRELRQVQTDRLLRSFQEGAIRLAVRRS